VAYSRGQRAALGRYGPSPVGAIGWSGTGPETGVPQILVIGSRHSSSSSFEPEVPPIPPLLTTSSWDRHRVVDVVRGVATGGYIGIYTSQISLPYKFLCGYWLFFFLFDPGQIRYCASVRLSSCFFYLLTTIYTPPQMKFLATPLDVVLVSTWRMRSKIGSAAFGFFRAYTTMVKFPTPNIVRGGVYICFLYFIIET